MAVYYRYIGFRVGYFSVALLCDGDAAAVAVVVRRCALSNNN